MAMFMIRCVEPPKKTIDPSAERLNKSDNKTGRTSRPLSVSTRVLDGDGRDNKRMYSYS
ncbi:hypothetical protein HHI36_017622, partial [Cryptolaemus montrouzieri]